MSLFRSHAWIIKIVILGIVFLRITLPIPFIGNVPVTEASILSSITSVITGSHVSAQETSSKDESGLNSQQMPLLEAPSSPITVGSTTSTSSVDLQSLVSSGLINPTPSPILSPTPTPSPTPVSNTTSSSNQTDAITTYKVQTGDTVSGIAVKFGISINTVLWANNLRQDSTLKVGQKLIILPITGITYKVKSGDTLQAIALKYKGDVQEIMAYNNMSDDTLKSGETIVIPDGEISSNSSSSSSSKSQSTASKVASTVKKVANAALGINIAKADTDSSTGNLADGFYMRPIKAGVRTQGVHGHNAVDLADSCGTPIYASASGTVTVSIADGAWNGGYGSYVVVSHSNGSQTLYAHLSKNEVNDGDTVSQGQEIGLMGETGEATGCHVHFEIRNGPINPF